MQTQFTTREAYDAQRLLQDLILTPRDPLQLNAQTLLNKYNMHPDNARTLADQKLKTEFGKIQATALVKRMPVIVPEPEPEPEPEQEPEPEPEPEPVKKGGKPVAKSVSKKNIAPPEEEPPPPEEPVEEPVDDKLTEADKTGDLRSTWRALDQPLWLLVQDSYDLAGKPNDTWRLPVMEMATGDNIRHTAEKAVAASSSNGIDAFYELHSPCAHMVTPAGDYLFFVRATIRGGKNGRPMHKVNIHLDSGLKDYAWVSLEDFPNYITDPKLLEIVTKLCTAEN